MLHYPSHPCLKFIPVQSGRWFHKHTVWSSLLSAVCDNSLLLKTLCATFCDDIRPLPHGNSVLSVHIPTALPLTFYSLLHSIGASCIAIPAFFVGKSTSVYNQPPMMMMIFCRWSQCAVVIEQVNSTVHRWMQCVLAMATATTREENGNFCITLTRTAGILT